MAMFKKKKNRGFTLVEVLVAAAILSIMVPPILSSFVAIARVNSKSRMKLSATTIANGVMESAKSFELAQVAKETDFQSEGFHIIAGYTGVAAELNPTTLSAASSKSVSKDGAGKYAFNANAAGKYVFYYPGVEMDGTKYDVLLTYTKDSGRTKPDVEVQLDDGTVLSKTTEQILGPVSVRVLTYYDINIKVFRGGSGLTAKPLAEITGTKADYN